MVAAGLAALTATPATAAPDGQWYLDALHIQDAHRASTGQGVTVAVIDSGIDNTRPALQGQLVPGKCFGSAADIPPTMDDVGHGTGMAGLIAGNGKDKRHILGVAPRAQLMPLCVTGEDTTDRAMFESITPAIRYAVDHGADVISMSLGGDEKHASLGDTLRKLHAAIAYAEQHNVVLVAAAGNKGQDKDGVPSPGRLPGVVAVAGTDENGGSWKGSITGKQVALAAPAENVLTTDTTNKYKDNKPVQSDGYQIAGGTSSATALVAGTAALVRSKYPEMDAANVINRLIKTADHKGAPGRNPQYGYGIVDPVRALTAHVDPVRSNPLGQLSAPQPSHQPSTHDAAAPKEHGSNVGLWLGLGGGVLVVVVVVVLVLVTRGRRRNAGDWQPGGHPTSGQEPSERYEARWRRP